MGPGPWAEALVEALPHVQRWSGATVVVKYGGAALAAEGAGLQRTILQDLVLLQAVGVRVVLVHGGGKAVSAMGERLGLESRFVDGLRVTSPETMEVAQMVQVGLVSRKILAELARLGGKGMGLSGQDAGGWLQGVPRVHVDAQGAQVDLGRVGDIAEVNAEVLQQLLDQGFIPVVSPVAVDAQLEALNVNADTVATAVAEAVGADRLLFLTDVSHIHGPSGPVGQATADDLKAWIDSGVISGGMVPKATACLDALHGGVGGVAVLDGRCPPAVLIELFTDQGSGTLVLPGREG